MKFDVTRQKNVRVWTIKGAVSKLRESFDFPNIAGQPDLANDDVGQGDESNSPTNNHIYVFDSPGPGVGSFVAGAIDQVVERMTFNEYVRVTFDGSQPQGNTNTGSRCSLKQPWHMLMWIQDSGSGWIERSGKPNEIKEGEITINTTDPTP